MTVKELFGSVRRQWLTVFAVSMILIGIGTLGAPSAYFWYLRQQGIDTNATYVVKAAGNIKKTDFVLGTPTHMSLPRLSISLDVKPGTYIQTSQDWRLDRTHAFYILPGTSPLSRTAAPLIYGHDIPAVFLKLHGMAIDEVLFVQNKAGKTLMFRYIGDNVVKPEQGVKLNAANDGKTLNLLTCTGQHFTERWIMHFHFVGEIKDPNKLEL